MLIERYPVRETGALATIATKLGLQDRKQYEGAVRQLLTDDKGMLAFVRSLFGALTEDMHCV
jgi:hypothetical protein